MTERRRFRVLTPDGLFSHDTFVLCAEQPPTIKKDCVLVVDEQTGGPLTVHETRLFPLHPTESPPVAHTPRSVCLKCGKVAGVVQDRVACPEHGGLHCGMLDPSDSAV